LEESGLGDVEQKQKHDSRNITYTKAHIIDLSIVTTLMVALVVAV
jgi:hypothetical protein